MFPRSDIVDTIFSDHHVDVGCRVLDKERDGLIGEDANLDRIRFFIVLILFSTSGTWDPAPTISWVMPLECVHSFKQASCGMVQG
jgi:hypothetical protein